MKRGEVHRTMLALRDALRESERKRMELEAVLQDFLQGKTPKLAEKIAPHWFSARVVSVQTEGSDHPAWVPTEHMTQEWVADLRGQGPIPPSLLVAFNAPGGDVMIATRVPRAIIRVGGQVLSEVADFRIED